MGVTFAVGLRARCVAVAFLVATMHAAVPVSPLVGMTRDQLLSRHGEPKSQIEAGNRVIFYYPRERIVLRDGVVVEVEVFAGEAGAGPPVNVKEAPTTDTRSTTASVQTPSASDSKVEIKVVRPPSKDARPALPTQTKVDAAPLESLPPRVVPETVPAPISVRPENAPPQSEPSNRASSPGMNQPPASESPVRTLEPEKSAAKNEVSELAEKNKKEDTIKAGRQTVEEASSPDESVFSGRAYLVALIVVAGGLAFLFWRRRQRQLDLAASSVENTPLETTSTPAPVFMGTGFTADVLNRLEWKQFEELVTAYYSKTGVVAVRTKSGPGSPVHIKISWKGEPRPFAYVQCIAHPAGLIDPSPVQALVAALGADDIRRGYIVTTGKFSVPARDLAEEKHLTLLPGDIFLEKLNALPAAARSEIMQSIGSGDQAIPSCPKCAAKMVKSAENPPVWRCPNHADQVIPIR